MQSRLRETRHGRAAQFRCRAAGSDRLQRALPKGLFLWLCKPLLRTTLFACGFYWVQDRTLPGYRYDARACVVANQAGPIELMYFLWNFPGTPVLDMSALSAFMLPGITALGILDSATVEQLADDTVPSPRSRSRGREQPSALAQYQCMMAVHNETHAGYHFGLARLCLFLSGSHERQRDQLNDDELLDGAFACGLPLQPIWVRCARAGEPHAFLRVLTSWSNQMEVLLLPMFAPTEEEKVDPELFRRNVMSALRDASSRLRRGRSTENPFSGGAAARKPAMEDSWRVVDDQDREDDDDSDWSMDDSEGEVHVDVERGKKRGRRKPSGSERSRGRSKENARASGDGGRRAERSKVQRDRDRVQREREKLQRKRSRTGMASPRASMPNLGSMESDDDLDLSEEEIPATHWGAKILREDGQFQGQGPRNLRPHPPPKGTRSKDRSARDRSRAKRSSLSDVHTFPDDDEIDIRTPRGPAGDIHRPGRTGKRNLSSSRASQRQAPERARTNKDDAVRGVASAKPVLHGGGAAGWQRMHKVGDYAGVVRWCVDCELAEDTLLVGMPLTDYEMGIVAPTFIDMLGLDEAVVTRQHENGGVGAVEELETSVRDAFRSLSRHLHPDKQSGRDPAGTDDATSKSKATADFQLLKLAKESLGDGKARARYLKKLGAFRRNAVRVPWSFSSAMRQQQK